MSVRIRRLALLLVTALSFSPVAYGAACTDVFSDGVNSNLAASGSTLDLSGVAWDDGDWKTTFTDGDYFVSAASFGNDYTLNVADGAQVRIFVDGSLRFGNGVRLNVNGEPGQLLLIVRGNITFGNNAVVNGMVYSSDAIRADNNLEVIGALAAADNIRLGNNTDIEYEGSGIGAGLLAGLCASSTSDGPVVLLANGRAEGPVAVSIDESVLFEVQVTDCPEPTFLTRQWRDTWTINGTEMSSPTSYASACDRSRISRDEIFDSPGQYEVEFLSEYRECFLFFCGSWAEHGSDSILVDVGDPKDDLTCFNDDFASGALSENWVTAVSMGSFTPQAVNGRLRMTENVSNQATAATLQLEIPGAENLIVLEFDYYAHGGSGADGIAVVLSDATITPQPGSYGGSLGYAQRTNENAGPGFAGGWIGIGLDEFGNFSNPTEGRSGGVGSRPDAVAIRGSGSGENGYRYLFGTGSLRPGIDATGPNSPHRYRITVDSRSPGLALVSVERDTSGTGNDYRELIEPFNALSEPGQASVPESFLLSLTGSTGGSHNIHELDNIQLCALQLNPVGKQIHHFEIEHDGVALTCQPEEVTIYACRDAACKDPFTDPVSATLSPTGWMGGDTVSLVSGTTSARLRHTNAESVTLGVIGSVPATRPQSTTLCRIGNGPLAADQCEIEFVESGLVIDMPAMIANRPATARVRAVREDDETQACVPAFENVTRRIDFWSTYVDPGTGNYPVMVNDEAAGRSLASASGVELAFDADGTAEIEVVYADAGRMQLDAVYTGSADTEDEGLVMPGADQFVSVPAGFCIQATSPDAACSGDPAGCSVLTAAGDPFELEVRAVAWQRAGEVGPEFCAGNATTPNFRFSELDLTHSLLAPSGGVPGDLGAVTLNFGQNDAGVATVDQSISEVGVFRLAIPAEQNYLDQLLPGGESAAMGRITPAYFQIETGASDPGLLAPECSVSDQFSYLGQPLAWSLPPEIVISARNRSGAITTNYTTAGFNKLTSSGVLRSFSATDEAPGAEAVEVSYQSPQPMSAEVVDPGILGFTFAASDETAETDRFIHDKPAAPSDPFEPVLSFSIDSVRDTDGVEAQDGHEFYPEADFEVRYGRLAMENVYGPETVDRLYMPLRTEYWNGSRYVVNAADYCTGWDTAGITAHPDTTSDFYQLASDTSSGAVEVGHGRIALEPNGEQGTDTLAWQLPEWLRADRDADGVLDDPSALATFGVYRGHDRIIYWREVR